MNVHIAQWPDLIPTLGSWTSEVRGQLIPNQPLDEMTTLRVGGPAQLFFRPVDEDDLAFFLKHLPAENSRDGSRARLEPVDPRWRA